MRKGYFFIICMLVLWSLALSCEKFVKIDPPATELTSPNIFMSDATALAAISAIYSQMMTVNSYSSGSNTSFSFLAAISSDEVDLTSTTKTAREFYDNRILSTNTTLGNSLWVAPYQQIYRCNAVIEGLVASNLVAVDLKRQLIGEAKFARAFAFFYLLNMFGDVPLTLTTDYETNSKVERSKVTKVYDQIVVDLKEAIELLHPSYTYSKNERVRANKFAAIALLSRVYLYLGKWVEAENMATLIIENGIYSLESLERTFLKNSKEAIWQLMRDNNNTYEATVFLITGSTPTNGILTPSLVELFSMSDRRKKVWIGQKIVGAKNYYYPTKYKSLGVASLTEYSVVLRLSEQYLIRAESRINQGKVAGGISDINVLRKRASDQAPDTLALLSEDMSKENALVALEKERRMELFTEWGHRWLDLKRWPSIQFPDDAAIRRADDVLIDAKLGWRKEWKLYPIPQAQIDNDPAMVNSQNPGYE